MKNQHNVDELLDRAASQIRSSEPEPRQVEEAAARVWQQLTSETAATAAGAAEITEIHGCDDYQALLPAYLADALPAARKLLLEDHTRECVPCRRALIDAREGKPPRRAGQRRAPAKVTPFPRPVVRWALAAVLVAGLGAALYFLSGALIYSGTAATVTTVDGQLFKVTATAHLPVAVGDEIRQGEVLRTGRDGGAVVRLADGSLVEMRKRSEMAVAEGHRGTTLELARGNVIVQAAEQRQRKLYVSTDDCLVSVTGTIFSVNHGTKGSRVSVVEGEVRVAHDGEEAVLHPGDVIATHAHLGVVPVEDEIAWSQNVDEYLALLKEYQALRRQIKEQVPPPGLRYSTRLLDLMPEDTVLYAAVPNLTETVARTHLVIQDQVSRNPVLERWWLEQRKSAHSVEGMIDEIVGKVADFGEFLGEELVVSAQSGSGSMDDFSGPLVLAEIVDAAGFRAFVEAQLADHGADGDVAFIDDPFAPTAAAEIYLWTTDDLVVGSPQLERIQQVASFVSGAENPFVGSDFHQRIAELYEEGLELLVAADLEGLIGAAVEASEPGEAQMFARLGVLDAQHLMVEQRTAGNAEHRAVLTFREARQGIMSWLAAPAPMGALDFISPEAKAVGAFVLKDPSAMVQDVMSFADGVEAEKVFEEFEATFGLDFTDFTDVIGGEFAFAIDGPLLPSPSWKLIIEVYDPARFQWIIEQGLVEANQHLAENGHDPLELTEQVVGGRTYYSLPVEGYAVHYTFVEGYFVAGPNRSLLDRAIRYRDSGYSITESSQFTKLLPMDGQNNVSALFYQDLSSLVQEAAEMIGDGVLTEEQRQAVAELADGAKPTLGYIYGYDRRIIAAVSSETSFMDMLVQGMLGLENPLAFASILDQLPMGL